MGSCGLLGGNGLRPFPGLLRWRARGSWTGGHGGSGACGSGRAFAGGCAICGWDGSSGDPDETRAWIFILGVPTFAAIIDIAQVKSSVRYGNETPARQEAPGHPAFDPSGHRMGLYGHLSS